MRLVLFFPPHFSYLVEYIRVRYLRRRRRGYLLWFVRNAMTSDLGMASKRQNLLAKFVLVAVSLGSC